MDYDVVVIGSGAGGLSAALPLAQAGLKVLVCEQHEVPGGWTHSFTLGGYRFSPGVHYIGSLGRGESLRQIYEGLGVSEDLAFCEINPDGYDHIVIGDEYFNFPKGKENLVARLKDRFPEESKGIDGYFVTLGKIETGIKKIGHISNARDILAAARKLPELLRWLGKSGEDLIDKQITDPLLKGVLSGQAGDYGLPPSLGSAFMHAGITNHYLSGAYYPLGGAYTIPRAFVRAMKRAGGEIRLKTRVDKILLDGYKISGLRLENGETIRAKIVISNADPEITFGNMIGREFLSRKLLRKVNKVKYSTSALSLFFAVDMDLRAAGLDSGNLWFYDHKDINELYKQGMTDYILHADTPGMIFLNVTTLKDPSKMHSGHHTCEAFSYVSYEPFKSFEHSIQNVRKPGYQGLKEDLAWRMFKGLEKRIPGISDHITYWTLGTPLTTKHYLNCVDGNLYGIEKNASQVGPGAFPIKTEIDGLYLCGASTSSHGVAGATGSGLNAAKLILGCKVSDLLNKNGPALEIYPSEDLSKWPDKLQKQIEHGRKRS